ncbi:MAG: helix-turn-helix transcriptional regulator [Bacteroidetes bacterium]|nr:helix-turn-helix transcriptional regulator [Bacteroidota bacterium]
MKNKVKLNRVMRDLSQIDLAEKMGVSRQTVHAIESGKYVPSTVLALKICSIFEADITSIFELEEEDWK